MIHLERISKHISEERMTGLNPELWVCVGQGISREEVKDFLFDRGVSFVKNAVITPQALFEKISKPKALLGPLARQELLENLFDHPSISSRLQELNLLRKRRGFFKRLDRAIQAARLSFSHFDEYQAYIQKLDSRNENPLRQELEILSSGFEAWMEETSCWDYPLLLRKTAEILSEKGWPEDVLKPREILLFSEGTLESAEKRVWEELVRSVEVTPVEIDKGSKTPRYYWERWHTVDDSVEALADQIAESADSFEDVVLIPDEPAVRRSLTRALSTRGIPLKDPRDPTAVRSNESVKRGLLPLEMIASDFSRKKVFSWLKTFYGVTPEVKEWISEIIERGIRSGVQAFRGGNLETLGERLRELEEKLGGVQNVQEVRAAHLSILEENDRKIFDDFWAEIEKDLNQIGLNPKKSIAGWLVSLKNRIDQSSPPVDALKPSHGLSVYRLNQVPFYLGFEPKRIWMLSPPPNWLSLPSVGDYWFSDKDRDLLLGEFDVRSRITVVEDRKEVLNRWVGLAEEVYFLDSEYSWDGRERESILPLLRNLRGFQLTESEEKGSHPRWTSSFLFQPSSLSRDVVLPDEGEKKIRASVLDVYSRCPFKAMSMFRWFLEDLREPGPEIWPDVRGSLVHRALEVLVRSRDDVGSFSVSPKAALEMAWEASPPKGLYGGARVRKIFFHKTIQLLEKFIEKEKEYVERSQTKVLRLEDRERLRLKFENYEVLGVPDRIDEHEDGVFVIDYKTGSNLPSGREMLEMGYGLQLPFYALAARESLKKEVLGAQFIQINTKGSRNSGLFLKKYNGKAAGALVNARSKNHVLELEPEEVWEKAKEKVSEAVVQYRKGQFGVHPKKEAADCRMCSYTDLCGVKRF